MSIHAHGVPNWIDLHTGSVPEARDFYEALLGWSFRNRLTVLSSPPTDDVLAARGIGVGAAGISSSNPNPDGSMALALSADGGPAAEIIERGKSFDEMALLSNWVPYVYVDDLHTTLELVEAAGGLVASSPARRGDMATVATIMDPSDALLCLWEPVQLSGAAMHHPGTLTWIELETPDLDAATKFYAELFGWDAGVVSMGEDFKGDTYTLFTKNGERVAGAVETAMLGLDASWFPSFLVQDVDEVAAVCGSNGGVLMAEPLDIPVGRQAVLVDPGGAAFSVLGPKSNRPRPL
ncbi:MAG: VOC family protein [Actinomycetota bacterium]